MQQTQNKEVFLELMVNNVFVGPGSIGTVSQISPAYNRMVNELHERGYSVFADPSHLIFDMPMRMLVGGKVEGGDVERVQWRLNIQQVVAEYGLDRVLRVSGFYIPHPSVSLEKEVGSS